MRRATRVQPAAHVDRALLWFSILSPSEQRATILRLVDRGFSDNYVASATCKDVATIRRIIAERDLA